MIKLTERREIMSYKPSALRKRHDVYHKSIRGRSFGSYSVGRECINVH